MSRLQASQNEIDNSGIMWRKSGHSNSQGTCVEIAERGSAILIDGFIYVRDSKDPKGGVLKFTEQEWGAFVAGVKDGEFDALQG